MPSAQVSRNEDGTWHAPGVPTHFRTKAEAIRALAEHRAELQRAKEQPAAPAPAPEPITIPVPTGIISIAPPAPGTPPDDSDYKPRF